MASGGMVWILLMLYLCTGPSLGRHLRQRVATYVLSSSLQPQYKHKTAVVGNSSDSIDPFFGESRNFTQVNRIRPNQSALPLNLNALTSNSSGSVGSGKSSSNEPPAATRIVCDGREITDGRVWFGIPGHHAKRSRNNQQRGRHRIKGLDQPNVGGNDREATLTPQPCLKLTEHINDFGENFYPRLVRGATCESTCGQQNKDEISGKMPLTCWPKTQSVMVLQRIANQQNCHLVDGNSKAIKISGHFWKPVFKDVIFGCECVDQKPRNNM